MFMDKKLDNYYLRAISKNDRKGLDERLFKNLGADVHLQQRPETSYDLDIEERDNAKKATSTNIRKRSVLKAI
jgi:hypothetical protein